MATMIIVLVMCNKRMLQEWKCSLPRTLNDQWDGLALRWTCSGTPGTAMCIANMQLSIPGS